MSKIVSDREQRKAEREFAKNEKVVKKIEKTGKDIDYNFYSVELPDISRAANGSWDFGGEYVAIDTIEEFRAYAEANNELFEIIKAQYPEIIATIYRQAISNLSDSNKRTLAGKMLAGDTFDLDKIAASTASYEWGNQTPTISYVISKVNGDKKAGNPTTIKPYKKAKKEVMDYLKGGRDQRGFFLPEITENGVVVTPTKDKRLSPRFFAVGANEYTEDQVREYLLANAVTTAERYGSADRAEAERQDIVNAIIERAMLAYDAVMKEDPRTLQIATEEMNYLCSIIYAPDFSVIEEMAAKKVRRRATKDIDPIVTPTGGADDFEDDSFAEQPVSRLGTIIVEGATHSETDIENGKLVLKLTNKGGLVYEVRMEENEQTLRAVPIEKIDDSKQMQ